MSSPLSDTLHQELVAALKSHDSARASCIRQVKSKLQEHTNAPGFKGDVTDDVVLEVIGSYVKSLDKSIVELSAGGDRGAGLVQRYRAEIGYLNQFLPAPLSQEEVLALVKKTVQAMGISDPKQGGRVMGAIMKEHRGTVTAPKLKEAIAQVLGAS